MSHSASSIFPDAARANTEASFIEGQPFNKIIVGGGIAGLMAAYEILRAVRQPYRLAVLTERINPPAAAGSSVELGLDGFGVSCPTREDVHARIRAGLEHLQDVVARERISCRLDMNYQLLGRGTQELQDTAQWLVKNFGYRADEFSPVAEKDRVQFRGFTAAMAVHPSGQINAPEFLSGLVDAIERMGGTVIKGVRYRRHQTHASRDVTEIVTNKGSFYSQEAPLLALGAAQTFVAEELPVKIFPRYTMALHVPLTAADAAKISSVPVGFCDTAITGDIFWGSLDSRRVLTIGFGDLADPADKPKLAQALRERFTALLPDLATKYADQTTFSFGPMACTDNKLPVVARCKGFDVINGFSSRGIAPGVAVAQDYARWVVYAQDANLRLWESLNNTQLQPMPQPAVPAFRPPQAGLAAGTSGPIAPA